MSNVGDFTDRKDRPAYVRFERIAVEDKAASVRDGHYVARDIDMVLITPPYSKDVFKIKAPQWIENMAQDVQNGRLPQQWMDDYLKAYEHFKRGEELPLTGIPIKGWGVISPAQQETLIRMHVLTVEDLSAMNDEGVKRIGMGGMDLKNKASAWLRQLNDKGALTQEFAALKSENSLLKSNVATLTGQVQALMAQVQVQNGYAPQSAPEIAGIDVSDILEPVEVQATPGKRGPGRPKAIPPMTQPAGQI